MGYFSTYWVNRQITVHGLESSAGLLDNNNNANLESIFANRSYCNVFLKHLVREISVENIFFLADVMAFKNAFITHRKLSREVPGFTCRIPLELARYQYVKDRTFVHYAWSISKIYVDGSSIFYVTAISDEVRATLLEFVENLSPFLESDNEDKVDYEKLCTAFDAACKDVYEILKNSYSRFLKTSEFKTFQFQSVSVEMTEVMPSSQQNIMPTNQ